MYDLLLSNARIVDGTGSPRYQGDVALEGGKIAAVGEVSDREARRVIDVEGAVVAPGFIDLHSHSDMQLPEYPRGESMITQGITTQLVGNCGLSPFPVVPEKIEFLYNLLFFGKPKQLDWHDAATFMTYLDNLPLAGNVALMVGHNAVRVGAMGYDEREPTEAELDRMKHWSRILSRPGFSVSRPGLSTCRAVTARPPNWLNWRRSAKNTAVFMPAISGARV
jgi:N-acyl-D-amino-acid deacylase